MVGSVRGGTVMHKRVTATLAALMWSSIATAAQAQAQPMQPVDKWQLDFGETQCTAARPYGDAASPTILAIIPSLNGAYYKVMVSVPQAGPAYAKELRGSVDFGRGPIASELLYFGKSGVKQSAYQLTLSAADMAQAEAAGSMTVKADRETFDFALSTMPSLLAGLRTCDSDLQRYWNMGGNSAAITSGAPLGDIHAVLKAKDYPTAAVAMKPRTSVQYQLLVDDKGAIAGCDALSPSGAQVIDTTGCQVLAGKVKFRPAKDASGKPVRSAWITPPLEWQPRGGSALDSGCTKVSSDGSTLVDMCGQEQFNRMRNEPRGPAQPPPPPPPPR
jgi:hypothetical protein